MPTDLFASAPSAFGDGVFFCCEADGARRDVFLMPDIFRRMTPFAHRCRDRVLLARVEGGAFVTAARRKAAGMPAPALLVLHWDDVAGALTNYLITSGNRPPR